MGLLGGGSLAAGMAGPVIRPGWRPFGTQGQCPTPRPAAMRTHWSQFRCDHSLTVKAGAIRDGGWGQAAWPPALAR